MTQLVRDRDEDAHADPTGGELVLSLPAHDLRVRESASEREAAVIAAAVGAHVLDGQRERDDDDAPERCDPWILHGRLRVKCRCPRDVARGEEWKAAARAYHR
jgi:hypothetical protein